MKSSWVPPERVEALYEKVLAGNKFASINSPTAGVRSNEELPVGNSDIQLYSFDSKWPKGWYITRGVAFRSRIKIRCFCG